MANGVKKTKGKTALCIAAAAAALTLLAANWLAQAAERDFSLRADMTREQSTVLTGDTKSKLGGLKSDIYIYYVGSPGQDVIADTLLQSYDASSPVISYSVIGKDALPAAWKDAGAGEGSIVISETASVSAGGRFDVIAREELYEKAGVFGRGAFKGESAITPAIMRVAGEITKRVVFLEGQGETKPCEKLLGDLDSLYYETLFNDAEAALDTKADTLVIMSPKEDISAKAYKNIKGFLDAGGSAAFLMNGAQGLGNLGALLMGFGMTIEEKMVLSGNPLRTYESPENILPYISAEGEALGLTGPSPVLSASRPVTVAERTQAQVTPLLLSDESCFLKEPESPSLEKTPEDTAGSYIVGALASRNGARIALVTSSSLAVSDKDYSLSGNSALLLGIVNLLSGGAAVADAPQSAYGIALARSAGTAEPALLIAAAALLSIAVLAAGFIRRRIRNKQ